MNLPRFHRLRARAVTLAAGCGILWLTAAAPAAELTLKVADSAAPDAVAGPVRETLQPQSLQLSDAGKPLYEFWFCREIPVTAKPASADKALDAIAQTTLIGAVKVGSPTRDYRDDDLDAGVYTMHFALQPGDGDHLGTSEFTYFLVLVPAKDDPKPGALASFGALVKASGKDTASGHPHILSLRPSPPDSGKLPALEQPAPDHKSIRLQLPARAGNDPVTLMFDLVYQGHYKK